MLGKCSASELHPQPCTHINLQNPLGLTVVQLAWILATGKPGFRLSSVVESGGRTVNSSRPLPLTCGMEKKGLSRNTLAGIDSEVAGGRILTLVLCVGREGRGYRILAPFMEELSNKVLQK